MGSDYRNYYGLPVTLASEDPTAIGYYEQQAGSRGEYDVGRFGLVVKLLDSDPYYAAVVYQYGTAIAIVECLPGKQGLVRGLAEDPDVNNLRMVFGIRVPE
jgi:hypothetical protein